MYNVTNELEARISNPTRLSENTNLQVQFTIFYVTFKQIILDILVKTNT